MRVVVDTNVLISALLRPGGSPGLVLQRLAEGDFVILYSTALLDELVEVSARPWLAKKYSVGPAEVAALLRLILLRGSPVEIKSRLRVSRDAEDDRVLETATDGRADLVVSGDGDLLALQEFGKIPIVSASAFLRLLRESRSSA